MALRNSLKYLLVISISFSLFSCTTSFNEQLKNIDSNLKKTFKVLDKTSSLNEKVDDQNLNQSEVKTKETANKKVDKENILQPKKKSTVKIAKITTKKIEKKENGAFWRSERRIFWGPTRNFRVSALCLCATTQQAKKRKKSDARSIMAVLDAS